MKTTTSAPLQLIFVALAISLCPTTLKAQNCGLPAIPDGTITTTQDRDQMMCQQSLVFPTLPVRQGNAWPWNDPTAPTNAWPTSMANPEGNWTDPQGHVVVRTAWGNWHTYDGLPQFAPNPSVHFPNIPANLNGGAMSGFGDYGPLSTPRYTDIDLLKMKGGAPVQRREDWWIKRRPEISSFVQNELYGTTLADFKPKITWTVAPGNPSTGSVVGSDGHTYAFIRKVITGTIDTSDYPALRHAPRVTATCLIQMEKVGTKTPVVVTYGENTFQFTAPYGVSVCSYSPTQVQPDSGGANLSDYVIGLKNHGTWRHPDDPGSLVIWGWGVSRLIDYFATDADFNADKVAVEGHSRYGKATLVTAAYDDRVVVAWPSDAGAMGTALARRTYGETLDFVSSSTSEYHWLAGVAMTYAGRLNPNSLFPRRVELLDVDAHSTESLIAPRALFISNGTDTPPGFGDAWADPRGCFLSGFLASPVWDFLGWKGQIILPGTPFTTDAAYTPPAGCTQCSKAAESIGGTPAFDLALIDGTVGWRRQKEGHTPTPNWPSFMLFASRYLNDGRPVIASGQSFVLGTGVANVVGTVSASDPDSTDTLGGWQVKGGSGAYKFGIDSATGQIKVVDASAIDFANTDSYDLILMVGDGKLPSHDQTVTLTIPQKLNVCHNGHTISINRHAIGTHLDKGDLLGSCE
jgi:hypothetical protein